MMPTVKPPRYAGRSRKMRRPAQLALPLRTWGGPRKRAGRKPKADRAGVPHRPRLTFAARFPAHVTVRMLPHVWSLRSRRSFKVIGIAARAAGQRLGMRLCEFSVQGNHLHLIVEADDRRSLGRGMKGLGVRLARRLNTLMRRKGAVLSDRYHAHVLRTPTEVRHALHYVRHNHEKHRSRLGEPMPSGYVDPFSSASREHGILLPSPATWLLRQAVSRADQPGAGGHRGHQTHGG